MNKITDWFDTRSYDITTGIVIGLYALLLCIEGYDVPDTIYQMVKVAEQGLVVILCTDVLFRAVTRTRIECKSPWFWFDVATTLIALIPGYDIFRAFRLLRVLKVIPYFKKSINWMWEAIRVSIPDIGMGFVLILVNALVGMRAFGKQMPDQYQHIHDALLTSLSLVYLDNIRDVYAEMFETAPVPAFTHLLVSTIIILIIVPIIIGKVLNSRGV